MRPQPRTPIPIEIGGKSKAALRRTAQLGDGWIEVGSRTLEVFRERVSELQQMRAEFGRTGAFDVTVSDRALLKGTDGYAEVFEAGATRIVIDPPRTSSGSVDVDEFAQWAKEFSRDVIAPLADA